MAKTFRASVVKTEGDREKKKKEKETERVKEREIHRKRYLESSLRRGFSIAKL